MGVCLKTCRGGMLRPASVPKSCVELESASGPCAAHEASRSTVLPLFSLMSATEKSSTSNGARGSISLLPQAPLDVYKRQRSF